MRNRILRSRNLSNRRLRNNSGTSAGLSQPELTCVSHLVHRQVWFSNRRARWRKQVGSQQLQSNFGSNFGSFAGSSNPSSSGSGSLPAQPMNSFNPINQSQPLPPPPPPPTAPSASQSQPSTPMSAGSYFPFTPDQSAYSTLGELKDQTHQPL